jgi:hypothetical protein
MNHARFSFNNPTRLPVAASFVAREVCRMPESFGARLRERRERQHVALATIAEQTKIKLSLLEALERDDYSILRLYRNLIQLRQTHSTLVSGKLKDVTAAGHVLRFERTGKDNRFLVVLNMATEPVQIELAAGTVLSSTHLDREGKSVGGMVDLRGAEGMVVGLDYRDPTLSPHDLLQQLKSHPKIRPLLDGG